jgi:hypothetical protein
MGVTSGGPYFGAVWNCSGGVLPLVNPIPAAQSALVSCDSIGPPRSTRGAAQPWLALGATRWPRRELSNGWHSQPSKISRLPCDNYDTCCGCTMMGVSALRMHHDGVSAREIGRTLGVARSMIQDNLRRAPAIGIVWLVPAELRRRGAPGPEKICEIMHRA